MTKATTLRLIPALLAAAFSTAASAAGFQLLEQNASGIGNAYAGSAAVAENASTIFFNPAGMTELKAREVSGGLTAVRPSFNFSNKASDPNTVNPRFVGPATNVVSGDGGDGGHLGFLPNAYLSWALDKDLYLGLGIGAPFGLKTEYDRGWVGAAQSLEFDIKTVNVNPSMAYRVNEMVSVGFGVNWQRIEAEYKRQVGTADYPAVAFPAASSTAKLKLGDNAWGWNAGVLFKLSTATKIGVSYRSTMDYTAKGDLTVSSASARIAAGSGNTKADIKLPDTFVLSGAHMLDKDWELLGDISWTGWSTIPKVDVVRTSGAAAGTTAQTLLTDFRDTWRVAVGANYRLSDTLKLKAGLAFDQTPVQDEDTRLVSLPDNDRTWFSLGAQWKADATTTLDVGAAYLYVPDTKIHNDERVTASNPRNVAAALSGNRGLVDGTYDDSVWILGAQLSMAF